MNRWTEGFRDGLIDTQIVSIADLIMKKDIYLLKRSDFMLLWELVTQFM